MLTWCGLQVAWPHCRWASPSSRPLSQVLTRKRRHPPRRRNDADEMPQLHGAVLTLNTHNLACAGKGGLNYGWRDKLHKSIGLLSYLVSGLAIISVVNAPWGKGNLGGPNGQRGAVCLRVCTFLLLPGVLVGLFCVVGGMMPRWCAYQ